MMQLSVRHITHFTYEAPIRDSIMEVRLCPRTDARQQCYSFELDVKPHAQLFSYQDFLGNTIHHFDIPGLHDDLLLESRALVEVRSPPEVPDALPPSAWDVPPDLEPADRLEMTMPSQFARPSDPLLALRDELDVVRRDDPLSLLRELNGRLYESFEYSPRSTHAQSPIEDALRTRSGVCQDLAHIFIILVRLLDIPCRYVSGYLFHRRDGSNGHDRSAEAGSHAWAEAYLPALGWVGFDPTIDILAAERHIRVALGRDYADVSPTRGVYKGDARSTLRVGVSVERARFPVRDQGEPELALVSQGSEKD
ncbi:MAG: transglutaminase family protein, partial [Gemmatimonadota bacterium]